MTATRVMALAALLVAVGIGIGALGSHALANVLTARQLVSLGTAVDYQLFNSIGLLMVGLLMRNHVQNSRLPLIAWMLLLGILFFSGGIYSMLAGAPRTLGFITPVGGVMLIGAWLWLAIELWRGR